MQRNVGSSVQVWLSRYLIVLAAWLAVGGRGSAADFKGAAEVLRQAAQASPKPKEKAKDPFAPFRDKLKAFGGQSTNLAPATAAAQWLALGDELEQIVTDPANLQSSSGMRGIGPVQFDEVMKVLPPPGAWAELEKAVEARATKTSKSSQERDLGLRLIVHTLTKNIAQRAEDLKALDALAKKGNNPSSAYEFTSVFQMLNEAILATMDDPEAILRMLEAQLPAAGDYPTPLRIPNLVVMVGPEKAEAFLRKALKTSHALEMESGTPTRKLAGKLAIEMADQMTHPHWELVNSLDSVELFEALDKKFNKKETAATAGTTGFFGVNLDRRMDRNDSQAKLYYFLGLIARNRTDDAIKVAKEFDRNNSVYFPPEVIKQMERAGLTQQLNTFFAALLKDTPESPFWSEYVRVAAHAGHSDEALALVRTTSENKDLSRARRAELKALLPAALLANDEVEAGIAELRRSLTNREPANSRGRYSYSTSELGETGLAMARIGQLLDRKDWIEEGIAATRNKPQDTADEEFAEWNNPEVVLADFLSELGRGPEAEEVLLKALSRQVAKSQAPAERRGYRSNGSSRTAAGSVLAALMKVYHDAGRFEDVVRLLDEAEYWGAKDLLQLQNENGSASAWRSFGGHHSVETPLAYYAASALAKAGRKKEAAAILEYLFEKEPGLDRLYELMLVLEPANPVARLDQLFARDPFEERPLIWKAHWLRAQGKLEEAEQTARKAISIDPSDGEEGPGDRMRAHTELAEIRAARGDHKEAEFFRGAVAAIRESEMADRLHAAGLLKRAVKMYQDSLAKFADAYCIQSRLAIQLADLGQHEQAEEHYRRAYELMPESFGRVESHCFGCERAFEGERAQGIAEKVFSQLALKTPNKPQVHYLLGYLRDEQERPAEALTHYREAVRLDRDYLSAWQRIAGVSTKAMVPAAERDAVIFNLLRLDPRHRHTAYYPGAAADLAALWTHVAEANLSIPPAPATLYLLAASKKKLEEKAAEPKGDDEEEMIQRMAMYDEMQTLTPASAVIQNGFIRAGSSLVSNSIRQLE